jgi:endonuclease YncB( thermonuclease family)
VRLTMLMRSLLLLVLLPLCALAHPGGVDSEGCHRDSRDGERHCDSARARNVAKKAHFDERNPPKPGDEGVLYGTFVSIVDGDTFRAKVQGAVMKFRLQAVDAPEKDQPYGDRSTAELAKLIRGRDLVFVFDDVDHHGRIVARVWVGNVDVNKELIRKGAAWFDSEYARDNELHNEEEEARKDKRGLWALPKEKRVEPWVWRKR